MWSLKYSMSYTPRKVWVAMNVTTIPEAKQIERTFGHDVVLRTPQA
jgi:hypothetical protein